MGKKGIYYLGILKAGGAECANTIRILRCSYVEKTAGRQHLFIAHWVLCGMSPHLFSIRTHGVGPTLLYTEYRAFVHVVELSQHLPSLSLPGVYSHPTIAQ